MEGKVVSSEVFWKSIFETAEGFLRSYLGEKVDLLIVFLKENVFPQIQERGTQCFNAIGNTGNYILDLISNAILQIGKFIIDAIDQCVGFCWNVVAKIFGITGNVATTLGLGDDFVSKFVNILTNNMASFTLACLLIITCLVAYIFWNDKNSVVRKLAEAKKDHDDTKAVFRKQMDNYQALARVQEDQVNLLKSELSECKKKIEDLNAKIDNNHQRDLQNEGIRIVNAVPRVNEGGCVIL